MKKSVLLLPWFLLSSLRAEVQLVHSFEFGLQYPASQLVQAADGNFYGTATDGGASATAGGAGVGGIFRVTPAGVITNIASFFGTNGANPATGLTVGPDGLLYGTTQNGGANNLGVVFNVTTGGALNLLYSFDGIHGSAPQTSLTLGSDGNFYGTTSAGGANNRGATFKITPTGALTTLFSFGMSNATPGSALCLGPDGNFYGTTENGPANNNGAYNYGTVYRLTPAGGFTQLAALTNTLGIVGSAYPNPQLITVSNVMYGTLYSGSTNGFGCFYALTTNGVFSPLLAFTSGNGGWPVGGLTLGTDGNFYGAAEAGGAGYGVLFEIAQTNAIHPAWQGQLAAIFTGTNGSSAVGGLTLGQDGKFYGVTVHGGDSGWGEFYNLPGSGGGAITGLTSFNNIGGVTPHTALTLAPDGNFYGTTYGGGPADDGIVFRVATDGTFTQVAAFGGANGYEPNTSLCLGPDGALYGTALYGGAANGGTLYSVSLNGAMKILYAFTNGISGSWPLGGLAMGPDNRIYGTTSTGGTNGVGTIFCYNTNGTLSTLVAFNGTNGQSPQGTLAWNYSDGHCYGTTYGGGAKGDGTVFRFDTNGNFNTVATFAGTNGSAPIAGLTQADDGSFYGSCYGDSYLYRINPGSNSLIAVVNNAAKLSGSVEYAGFTRGPDGGLYTVTYTGGVINGGSLLRMDTNGNIGLLSTFSSATGDYPYPAPVFGPDGYYYGTTSAGGPGGGGTIYRYVPDRITACNRMGSNVIITATGTTGGSYALYATTNLVSGSWTNIASAVANYALVTLTDTNSGKYLRRFYRTAAQ